MSKTTFYRPATIPFGPPGVPDISIGNGWSVQSSDLQRPAGTRLPNDWGASGYLPPTPAEPSVETGSVQPSDIPSRLDPLFQRSIQPLGPPGITTPSGLGFSFQPSDLKFIPRLIQDWGWQGQLPITRPATPSILGFSNQLPSPDLKRPILMNLDWGSPARIPPPPRTPSILGWTVQWSDLRIPIRQPLDWGVVGALPAAPATPSILGWSMQGTDLLARPRLVVLDGVSTIVPAGQILTGWSVQFADLRQRFDLLLQQTQSLGAALDEVPDIVIPFGWSVQSTVILQAPTLLQGLAGVSPIFPPAFPLSGWSVQHSNLQTLIGKLFEDRGSLPILPTAFPISGWSVQSLELLAKARAIELQNSLPNVTAAIATILSGWSIQHSSIGLRPLTVSLENSLPGWYGFVTDIKPFVFGPVIFGRVGIYRPGMTAGERY